MKYFFAIRNVSDFDLMVSATGSHLEEVAANWPAEGIPLPKQTSVTFPVTKTFPNQMADQHLHGDGLAGGRHLDGEL